ncbi:MAG: hypothetical protein IPO70_03445 [Bacteroidetes bacterium]|nr:hypothetical protein [Bacteroidota bacterium]
MALAKYLSKHKHKMTDARTKIISVALILFSPILLIVLENETVSALMFFAFYFSTLP